MASFLSALPRLAASTLPSANNLPKDFKIIRLVVENDFIKSVVVEDDSVKDKAKATDGKSFMFTVKSR